MRPPAGCGTPGRCRPCRRPHGRARLRPRHDGPAVVVLDGFHRRRPRRHDWRSCLGGSAVWLHVVGASGARRRMARHALAAARERRLARPQHRRGPQRPAGCRLCLPAGRRSACEQGTASVRPGRLGDRTIRREDEHGCTSFSTRRRACGNGRSHGACSSSHPPTSSSSGRWRRQPRRAASTLADSSCTRSVLSGPRRSRSEASTGRWMGRRRRLRRSAGWSRRWHLPGGSPPDG